MKRMYNNSKYFFIFAHPDDEIYSCVLINRFIKMKKDVHVIYLTSGDAGGGPELREKEVLKASELIEVENTRIHFLRIPEKEIFKKINKAITLLSKLADKYCPDCVFGHNFEGGHEAHDIASFCAFELAKKKKITNLYFFPIYYGKPHKRKGARFKPTVKKFITLKFTDKEKELKEKVLNCHKSQKQHFAGLEKSSRDYFKLLFSREVYRRISRPINYRKKPMAEIGYEYHRNGFKFLDFLRTVKKVK